MGKTQLINYFKKPTFILALILVSFFARELFLAALFPMFTGQDESRHYNTVQFMAEPEDKPWTVSYDGKNISKNKDKHLLETYNFSEEIRETAKTAQINSFRQENYEKLSFSEGYIGKNEEEINRRVWNTYNDHYPPDVARLSAYHFLASQLEKLFHQESILTRFFLIRILSIILGVITILLAYFLAKRVGFSDQNSLILAAITSFQPKFSTYVTNINYDSLLILAFILFTLGGVMSLQNGLNWKNLLIMASSVILGLLTKGTAIVLLAVFIFLLLFHIYKMAKDRKSILKVSILSFSILLLLAFIFLQKYHIGTISPFKENASFLATIASFVDYLSDTLPTADSASKNYWGELNWTSSNFSGYFIKIIWAAEILAFIGLIIFFLSKKKLDFLPEKRYVIFLLGMIIALQLGVRFSDWQIFNQTGEIALGTPGRYFLPNLASHIILVFVGLGMIFKKEEHLRISLIIGLLLMFSFSSFIILNIILPRYYL